MDEISDSASAVKLMCGRINLLQTPSEEVIILPVHMEVARSDGDHCCTIYKTNKSKQRMGYFRLKNCEVITDKEVNKRFSVSTRNSINEGLKFEATSPEEASAWIAALKPRQGQQYPLGPMLFSRQKKERNRMNPDIDGNLCTLLPK